LGWSRGVDWAARSLEMELQAGSRVDVVCRLKAKRNPQFPGLELELIDMRLSSVQRGGI
jgi:single-stranded-DNA-specific exonuclease